MSPVPSDDPKRRGEGRAASRRVAPLARPSSWLALGAVAFALSSAWLFDDVLQEGFSSSSLIAEVDGLAISDVVFEAWLVSRNAWTLTREPWALFDTPHCFPAEKTLTYGIPMITMGLLAAPVSFFSASPALAYNVATLLLWGFAALAMFLLVRDWTGVPAAGAVAGILYAFSPIKLGEHVIHPSVWDSGWMVFALYFSQRLLARGRWRDAIGLAGAASLQIGASFYPLLASALLAPFFGVWLLRRYGLRSVRPAQLAFVAGVVLGALALCYGPYLAPRAEGELPARGFHYYLQWPHLIPGRKHSFGWLTVLLAVVGLCVPRRFAARRLGGDPRWWLLAGGLFVAVVAAGSGNQHLVRAVFGSPAPFTLPDPYALLSGVVPGLDIVRVVARLVVALLIASCVLAGFGAAWAIVRAGRFGGVVGCVLLGAAALANLSVNPAPLAATVAARPHEIGFFERLGALGNAGPIVEVPLHEPSRQVRVGPPRILLTRYHQRRTWTCFGSYRPAERGRVEDEVIRKLPDRDAQRQLREMGFTTLVVRHARPRGQRWVRRLDAGGMRDQALLREPRITAYELRP